MHVSSIRDFMAWLDSEGNVLHITELLAMPEVADRLLRSYGLYLHRSGEPLYMYLLTITGLQRAEPSLRGLLGSSWQLAGLWREQQPVAHRPPLPEALLHAMVVLAVSWGWLRFAGILLLAFYGACRPGKPLGALRTHLLLPEDLLAAASPQDRGYLLIPMPKSRRRGGARIQHVGLKGVGLIRTLHRIFGSLQPTEPLYPFSASAFRRRWDKVLQALQVPKSIGFTPGCLRGGGAVQQYRADVPVASILWQMRLRNMQTLEHYLQEVAALNSLLCIPDKAKDYIRVLSAAFCEVLEWP